MKPLFVFCTLLLLCSDSFGGWLYGSSAEIGGIKLEDDKREGAQVVGVTPGGPGASAAILVGDTITAVDGQPVRNTADCFAAIGNGKFFWKREAVRLELDRKNQHISVTLQPLPSHGSGDQPKPPVPFPATYRNYQILPRTISPDHKYAFIFPKRSKQYELKEYSLYLVTLDPFKILSQMPPGNGSSISGNRSYYVANWAKDSSTAVFIAGSRYGAEKVWVSQIRKGKVIKQSELTSAVRQQVRPDFKKSRAKRYNEYYDFVFDNEDRTTDVDGEILTERGWDLDGAGHVVIDCICATDPKGIDVHRWTVHFKGVWDISSGKWLRKAFTRIPPKSDD